MRGARLQMYALLRRARQQGALTGWHVSLVEGTPAAFPTERDWAYTEVYGPRRVRIVVRPGFARQPAARVTGLLLHELGHASLMTRALPHSERRADTEALRLFSRTIRYDMDDVQTTGRGVSPRPRHLPA